MHTLACKDFNLKCDFVTQPDATIDGAIKKAQEHSKAEHPDAVAIMQLIGPEIAMALMKAKIKEKK